MKLTNGGDLGGVFPNRRPEPTGKRAPEDEMIGGLQGLGAEGAASSRGLDDVLAEEDIPRVNPSLHQKPGEEANLTRGKVPPDELLGRHLHATKVAQPVHAGGREERALRAALEVPGPP